MRRNNVYHAVDIPDCFKTQGTCIKEVEADPSKLGDVPDHLRTREMCDKAGTGKSLSLQYVPDWFVTKGQVNMWHNDYYDGDSVYWVDEDDKFFELYNGHKKRKAQKAQIKEKLMLIAWHPSRR